MDLYQTLIKYNPQWTRLEVQCIIIVLLAAFVTACFLLRAKRIVRSQAIGGIGLLVALLMIFGTTVLTRVSGSESQWYLNPFRSWERVFAGSREMLWESLLNILLLLPVGILLPFTLHRRVRWWQGLLVGIAISAVIELGQLLWRRGLFEVDDIIHNALGCMIGCMISSWWAKRWKHW